ncbi:MAG: EamA family transporter [Clostridiales bacterium]|nr:EamA family transporter [Clostridiales bacterium]HOC08653.1 EamA family transporter [Bacillota bacterium]HQA47398.1 EamA family transporter [Bacillota bacterium]HQD41885.1 EamA family transporter [Bacillota bacterium]
MKLRGSTLVILAAFFYGINVVISKTAYTEGANPMFVLAMRFLIASVLLWSYNLVSKGRESARASAGQLKVLVIIGGAVYAAFSMFYYNSINHIPVSLASVIFYLYPVVVNVFMITVIGERVVPRQILALIMATLGCFLMVWSPVSDYNVLGILLAFGACFSFSTYLILLDSKFAESLKSLEPLTVTAYITSAAAITLLASALLTGSLWAAVTPKAWLAVLASAFFSTFLSNLLFFTGLRETGSSRASILSTFEPVVSVALGVIMLDEVLTLFQFSGVAMIIVAVIIINMLKMGNAEDK